MNILICGDSFACDWSVKSPELSGWCLWLAKDHNVTNLAQAGVGEYKVLKQLQSVDLAKYDAVIISHSSPNRVYCTDHPIHKGDPLHGESDLIYSDISEHQDDPDALIGVKYFERYFDFDYYKDMANMCCMEILNTLGQYPHINQFHIQNFYNKHKYADLPEFFNINELLSKHPGNFGHLDDTGNKKLYNIITTWLNKVNTSESLP